ncbi:hypothetical protein [Sphingobacterium faecium]|uniref:hypothetical protein n=1 Tax=Sphingobacterium faecium TaxID=34087 RepID=UPI0032096F3F
MGLAGILSTGYKVLKIDDFSDISYHIYTGAIIGFKFKGKQYRYYDNRDFLKNDYKKLIKDDVRFTEGFYEEDKFLEYLARTYDYGTLTLKNKLSLNALSTPVVGVDKVQLVRAKTSVPHVAPLKFERITWDYTVESVYDQNSGNLIIPSTALVIDEIYSLDEVSSSYYANNIGLIANSIYIAQDQRVVAVGVLMSITLVIDQIVKETFPMLNKNSEFTEFIVSQLYHWKQELKHIDITLELLKDYERTLVSFYTAIYRSQLYLKSEDSDIKWLLLASVLSDSSIKILPLKNRIQILEIIGRGNIQGEVLSEFGGINKEKIVINIVKNINRGEENLFLNELAKEYISDQESTKTLFELLYKGIENGHFLVGVNNLDLFMTELYQVWLLSSYNPNELLPDDDLKGKDDNKPIAINYKSSTALLFFNDSNYSFEFDKDKIVVKPDDTVIHKEDAFHMFRCMLLMGTDSISGDQQLMEVYINGKQEMAIPLFYLKYIDDKKATENLKTGIQIGVDIALTLIPIANLTKLKHIFRLTKFGRAITGRAIVAGPGEVLLRIEFARGVLAAVEITAGLASIYYNYAKQVEQVCDVTSNEYDQEKCLNYQRLSNLFMYLGLVGGVLDLVAARKLKRVSQRILDSSIAATLDPDVSNILRRFAAPLGDSVEATNAFWIYVRDPKNSKLFSEEFKLWWEQSDHWTDALRVKFVEDFGSEVAQLKGLKTTAMMDGWSKLATRDIPLSSNIKFLEDPAVVDRLVGLYDDAHLRQVYQALLSAQTQPQSITAFLKTFDDIGAAYYPRFADDTSLVKSWFRYYDEPVLKGDFLILSNLKQIDFVEIFGNIKEQWFSRFRQQPYLFDRFNTATENSILIAKQDSNLWIRINRYYQRPKSLGEKLSSTYLMKRYRSQYAEVLVNTVEGKVQEILRLYPSRNFRADNFQLVSGLIDKKTGLTSDLFTNFNVKYFKNTENYNVYRNNLHPNVKKIVEQIENIKLDFNLDSKVNLEYTGHYIGAHAEVRALDDLSKKKFGDVIADEDIYYHWLENDVLGYNRNVTVKPDGTKVIMPRCADCFYITDLINFISM